MHVSDNCNYCLSLSYLRQLRGCSPPHRTQSHPSYLQALSRKQVKFVIANHIFLLEVMFSLTYRISLNKHLHGCFFFPSRLLETQCQSKRGQKLYEAGIYKISHICMHSLGNGKGSTELLV